MDFATYFRRDRYARLTGARLVETRRGYARARLKVTDRNMNGLDVAMGGAVFTLADLAFAAASNSGGRIAVAVQVSISFVKPGQGTLTAEARELARSARFSTCEVRVTDARGELVATFQGLAYLKKETIAELPDPLPRRPSRRAARRGGTRK
jgi:acyl-CoA thioesterase